MISNKKLYRGEKYKYIYFIKAILYKKSQQSEADYCDYYSYLGLFTQKLLLYNYLAFYLRIH